VEYEYIYFHEDEMECVLEELRNKGIFLDSKFKRFNYTEMIAGNDTFTLGKCENIGFLISKDFKLDINCYMLEKITIKIVKLDKGFEEFTYGRFRVKNSMIELDAEFDENLFYNLIPALQIQILKSEILLKENDLRAKTISKEESETIKEISKLSEVAKKTNDVLELKNILSEVSTYQVDFFRKFMQFKDINEEIFKHITKFEVISRKMGRWFVEKREELKDFLESMKYYESKFEQTLNGIRDLFSVVSLRLDMLRNKEYMEMQKRMSSLQAAAAIIEFVAVFYYTLKVWEYFVAIESMPKSIAFLILTMFTTSVVVYTEVLAELVREKRITVQFIITTALLILILFFMYFISSLYH